MTGPPQDCPAHADTSPRRSWESRMRENRPSGLTRGEGSFDARQADIAPQKGETPTQK